MKTKLIISLVALGLVAIVGTVAGLGLAGTFGSGISPQPERRSRQLLHPTRPSHRTQTSRRN